MMVGAKEAVLLLVVVVCSGSTPGDAQADESKMVIDGLDDTQLNKNPMVAYVERKFKDALAMDSGEEDRDGEEGENDDEEDAAANADDGTFSKFTGIQGHHDKRKYAFRSDLGKRSHIYNEPEKRYRSFRADLGKRYSRFRSDLGKRIDGASTQGELERLEQSDEGRDDLGVEAFHLRPEKRPRFRADLGKRARYEASRRVFRADLGKRPKFRSDLG